LDETKSPRKKSRTGVVVILLEPPGFGVIPSLKNWANNNEKKTPCFSP